MKRLPLMRLAALFGTCMLLSPVCAKVQEQTQPAKNQALYLALEDMQRRLDTIPQDTALSYTQREQDSQGNTRTSRYLANSKTGGVWSVVSEQGKLAQSQINWQSNLILQPSAFSVAQAKLVSETDSTWIFAIPNLVGVTSEGDRRAEEALDEANQALSKNLQTHLVVEKRTNRLASMHIFAKRGFKPSLLAKIHEFDVRIEFAEAWPGGPLVCAHTSRKLAGSYAFLASIEEFSTIQISEVVATKI